MLKIKIIGIVGKTGCGKSSAADYMTEKLPDAVKLDVDLLAKQIYAKRSDAVKKVAGCFGGEVLNSNGSINFSCLGRKVFSDCREMGKLNDIMFPLIYDEVSSFIKDNSDRKYIVIDAAVLFDAGLDGFCDSIIWIKAGKGKRENFLKCKNPGICSEDINQRVKNQKIKIKKSGVNFIVENDLALKDLYKKIDIIINSLR